MPFGQKSNKIFKKNQTKYSTKIILIDFKLDFVGFLAAGD